jgi:hypothetical protein
MLALVGLTVGAIALIPYERPARAALILVALLPVLAIVAGEISVDLLTTELTDISRYRL